MNTTDITAMQEFKVHVSKKLRQMNWNSNKQQTPQEDTFVVLKNYTEVQLLHKSMKVDVCEHFDGLCMLLESYWPPIMAVKDPYGFLYMLPTEEIRLIVKRKKKGVNVKNDHVLNTGWMHKLVHKYLKN